MLAALVRHRVLVTFVVRLRQNRRDGDVGEGEADEGEVDEGGGFEANKAR